MLPEETEFVAMMLQGFASPLASQARAKPSTTINKSPILPSMVPIKKIKIKKKSEYQACINNILACTSW